MERRASREALFNSLYLFQNYPGARRGKEREALKYLPMVRRDGQITPSL